MNCLLPLPTPENDNRRTIDFFKKSEREREEGIQNREKNIFYHGQWEQKCRCPVYVSFC